MLLFLVISFFLSLALPLSWSSASHLLFFAYFFSHFSHILPFTSFYSRLLLPRIFPTHSSLFFFPNFPCFVSLLFSHLFILHPTPPPFFPFPCSDSNISSSSASVSSTVNTGSQVRDCVVLYCTVLCCTALYCTVLYCTVLYCTVLYCTVLYCTVLYLLIYFLLPLYSLFIKLGLYLTSF